MEALVDPATVQGAAAIRANSSPTVTPSATRGRDLANSYA